MLAAALVWAPLRHCGPREGGLCAAPCLAVWGGSSCPQGAGARLIREVVDEQAEAARVCDSARSPRARSARVDPGALWLGRSVGSPSAMTTRALGLSARPWRLRRVVVPALIWGCAAWHMRPEALRAAESTIVRMTLIINSDFRRPERWLACPKRSWQSAKASVSHAWGARPPATMIVACVGRS